MKLRDAAMNAIVMTISTIVALVLCEVGARLFLNPANYLSASTIKDPALGMTIAPNSAGFDAWGFRNPSVPDTADVVALGDSHTFGNTAAMDDAWPSVVHRQTGLAVYNLGLGGYGPNQYFTLMKTKAVKLHPRWVFCGLYMGDDFENAFSITYGLDYWASLRKGQWAGVDANIWDTGTGPVGVSKRLRNWLSEHSLTYRLVVHVALAGFKEQVQFQRAARNEDPQISTLEVADKNIREAFRPIGIARRLDQSSEPVREGMRITFDLLNQMNGICRENGCRFVVVIIPTKESVFASYLENNAKIHLTEPINKIITNERIARKALIASLESSGIPYIDTLPKLQQTLGDQLYARTTEDMHPGKNGYRVIGDAVSAYLNQARNESQNAR